VTSLGILWLHDRANAALFVMVSIFVVIVVAGHWSSSMDRFVVISGCSSGGKSTFDCQAW
jgi:hypothetical protein